MGADTWDEDDQAEPRTARVPDTPELGAHGTKAAVLAALRSHPSVAWAEPMNVAGLPVEHRDRLGNIRRSFVRCGFAGLPDIIGQTKSGKFLAIETKRSRGWKVSKKQADFILLVQANHGVAFVARSAADVQRELKSALFLTESDVCV